MSRTDRAETWAACPPEAAWAALTDPLRVARWLPPPDMSARVEAWEPRPDGRLRLVLTYRDPAGSPGKSSGGHDVVQGRFLLAQAPCRLAWATLFEGAGEAFAGEMEMIWALEPSGRGTRIVLEARNVPDGIRPEDHAAGLGATLRQLAAEALRR